MTYKQINACFNTNPSNVVLTPGNYTKLDSLTLEQNTVCIVHNVIIRELTLNNCTLQGYEPGSQLNVEKSLVLNDTTVDRKNLSIVKCSYKASVIENGNPVYANTLVPTTADWIETPNGSWMYIYSDGSHAASTMMNINGNTCCFNADGVMVTGWQEIKGSWYYFDQAGHMKTGWLNLQGTWYDFSQDGTMRTGWIQYNGRWYYLSSKGPMAQSQWLSYGSHQYYLDNSGAMKTGWLLYDGDWYYFYSNGTLAVNTTIDGYTIDGNGVCVMG